MKHVMIALLGTLALVGCVKKNAPPIQIEVIAPAVSQQLTDRFHERFQKIGKVEYVTAENVYHVEVFYTLKDQEELYVMKMIRAYDPKQDLLSYQGQFPLDLMGEPDPNGRAYFPVTVDVKMNK